MLKKVLIGASLCALAATLSYAQDAAAPGRAARGGRAGGGVLNYTPTEEQWNNMNALGKAYVAKATEAAGNDVTLKFDLGVFCKATGGSSGPDRAAIGVPPNEAAFEQPFGAPSPAQVMPPQHMFDNFWWFGNTGVGAWLITSNDGYILFDTMDNMHEARDIIVGGMRKVGLDPAKIKYVVFGHNHLDHTGGGHYIQSNFHPVAIMGRDDWEIYFRTMEQQASAPPGPRTLDDKVPMTRGEDGKDGMTITVGDVTATIYEMTGHTPGSIGMIVPVKYQGKEHPILLVTAATDVHNREAFVGGYEHIWDEGIKAKVEGVYQVHPNTNMNLLARTRYVNDHYPPANNPLLYGADRTRRYIEIMRNCTLARMEALGW